MIQDSELHGSFLELSPKSVKAGVESEDQRLRQFCMCLLAYIAFREYD